MNRPTSSAILLNLIALLALLSFMSSCSIFIRPIEPRKDTATADYLALLTMFPDNQPGAGAEPYYFTEIREQPMTYGFFLSSEAFHFKSFPNDKSLKRIRQAVHWLLDNADADDDGLPGWGLPDAWDAFGDGSVNPANHPYTITTAIVLNSLDDALGIRSVWRPSERAAIMELMKNVALFWCQRVWTTEPFEGFFWYSPTPDDAQFVPNVSAMFLGSLVKILARQNKILSEAEKMLIKDRVEKTAKGMISKMVWKGGAPFCNYIEWPEDLQKEFYPNDLVHHAYFLWGMELFRSMDSKIHLPWSREQAIHSLDLFWKEEKIHNYPQTEPYDTDALFNEPAILWGAGMMLAFYARWGDAERTERCLDFIHEHYGPIPNLRLWPISHSDENIFYPRHAAHVLYGLAYRDFYTDRP